MAKKMIDKDQLKAESKKWGKRAAFFAVFGITGTAALLAYNLYRVSKGLDEIDWENLKL
jgi:hypothetical protein